MPVEVCWEVRRDECCFEFLTGIESCCKYMSELIAVVSIRITD